jgi:hypothetical protein
MLYHVNLAGIVLLLTNSLFAQTGPLSAISVGNNVLVSKARSSQQHFEVLISADPADPKYLLGCSMFQAEISRPGEKSVVAYVSSDGGKSWQETLNVEHYGDYIGDPTCVYGTGGEAYIAVLGGHGVSVYRSADFGMSWDRPIELPDMDREYLTVDNVSNKYRGRIYLNGSAGIHSMDSPDQPISSFSLWRSTDSNKSFKGPTRLAATQPNHGIEGMGNGVVLSNGDFVAITGELNDTLYGFNQGKMYEAIGRMVAVRSTDGGESFEPSVTINKWYIDSAHKPTCAVVPTIAVDSSRGPFKDRLYSAWPDLRSGRMEVLLSYSSDGGKVWSQPTVVNDDAPWPDRAGPDDFMPTVAVNWAGVVGVMWYDRRESADNLGYWPRFSASLDGGKTFQPSAKISEAPASFDNSKLVLSAPSTARVGGAISIGIDDMQFSGGHTAGLTATSDGIFHPLWVDNRTGVSQVWTASITVKGRAIDGAQEVSQGMTDVSAKILLHLDNANYDRKKKVASVEVSLENLSKEPISGALILRLSSINSELGSISAMNPDNRNSSSLKPEWDFTQLLQKGVLDAGGRSLPKRLEFNLAESSKETRQREGWLRMIQVKAQVLTVDVSGNKSTSPK